MQRSNIVKPVGDWKPSPRRGLYLVWEGVGYPCVTDALTGGSLTLTSPPVFAPTDSSDTAAFTLRLPLDHDPPGPEPDDSADHDDDDWPALRTVPWIPPFQGSTSNKID
ncbi:hypothetical protein CYMTET_38105 [Cymbomonas tetramitiformis]|uniref:Uncharacterized protein n=1 Tax=Cymbomonas tetramitiformis TaxID=36881 RepID=A0AAE0F596_9CHLO|nr:hypothetical protein CYMTET_38105 [Cymbomonas tetramitiformis]